MLLPSAKNQRRHFNLTNHTLKTYWSFNAGGNWCTFGTQSNLLLSIVKALL